MYDTIIIGTGTSGLTAAGILAQQGKKVAVVDNSPYGGTCALRGCQAKKYFITNIHLAAETRALVGKGYETPAVTNWSQLQKFKSDFTTHVTENTQQSLTRQGIDQYKGRASFQDAKHLVLDEGRKVLEAHSYLIATGAHTVPLKLEGSVIPPGSDDFLNLKEVPQSIVFIGGGYISLEFAFIAALAGSKVTVLQKMDKFLTIFPQSLLSPVLAEAADLGIKMLTGVDVTSIQKGSDGYYVRTLAHGDFHSAYVVSAIGRAPSIKDLHGEVIGLHTDRKGIITDKYMQTSVEGIYAAGDCVSSPMLAPVADMEAIAAATNILHPQSKAVDYDAVPSVVFTFPQMASVGLSVKEATKQGYTIRVKSGSGSEWMNYRRIQAKHVYYETIADEKTGKILGAHIVSPYAGDLINLFALAIKAGLTTADIKDLPWAYPTYTSDIKYMV